MHARRANVGALVKVCHAVVQNETAVAQGCRNGADDDCECSCRGIGLLCAHLAASNPHPFTAVYAPRAHLLLTMWPFPFC